VLADFWKEKPMRPQWIVSNWSCATAYDLSGLGENFFLEVCTGPFFQARPVRFRKFYRRPGPVVFRPGPAGPGPVQSGLPGQAPGPARYASGPARARFFRGENQARPGPARGPPGPCRPLQWSCAVLYTGWGIGGPRNKWVYNGLQIARLP
jgi:hypothetical protein